MCGPNDLELRLVEAAVADANSGARWDLIDLQTRRPGRNPEELLLAKAADLAMSPITRDQLLSLALEHRAHILHPDRPVIDLDCCAPSRVVIAGRIFAKGAHHVSVVKALVTHVEERHARRLGHDARFDLLAQRLDQEAVLPEALSHHPDIRATTATAQR